MSDAHIAVPGPQLPDVKMHIHRPNEPGVGQVVKTELCTNRKAASFVRHVEIDVSTCGLAGTLLPGQAFGVIPPGEDERGRPHKVRLYSVASPSWGEDGDGKVISTTVKRVLDENWDDHRLFLGVASNYLCDLREGDEVAVTGPAGKRFVLPASPGDHDYVFFATGTGIAPFRSMVKELLERPEPVSSKITLVMGAGYRTDLLYDEYFRSLTERHSNFRYLTAISRHEQEDGPGRLYVQDRLETHREEMTELLGSERGLVYICGIAGMELGIVKKIARMFDGSVRDQYVQVDAETLANVDNWDRKMLHKQVKLTRRMFLEVY